MSTTEYILNGTKYYVGVMERVGSEVTNPDGTVSEKDISALNLLVPTYGAWAGPEWAANERVPVGSAIDWDFQACMNESILLPDADPMTCSSLVDAAAKHHDWNYEVAEHSPGSEAELKLVADKELLDDIATAQQQLKAAGSYMYTCLCGTGNDANNVQAEYYTSTSFDTEENKYAGLLSVAFTIKLVADELFVAKEAVVNTFKSIWDYVTGALGGTKEITYSDSVVKVSAKEENGNVLYTYKDPDVTNDNYAAAWALDPDSTKVYGLGRIDFGDDGTQPDEIFSYLGDGKYEINGSTGDDVITLGDAPQFEIDGGGGDDEYIIDDNDDVIVETADDGDDTVRSSVSYTLPDNVEDLILVGEDSIDGTGNDLDNTITGDGNNVIEGGAGDDTIYAGTGTNKLTDESGDDEYYLSTGTDTIIDADGKGKIFIDSEQLIGGEEETAVDVDGNKYGTGRFSDPTGNVYVWSKEEGSSVTINDNKTIENFHNGDLGIYLDKFEGVSDISETDYALMAGAAYISTRPAEINQFPVPEDWTKFNYVTLGSGFEAVSFINGDEIVISFAGTDPGDWLGDIAADIGLASGFGSIQLKQAAEYYMQVRVDNPDAKISFTGHSLGGGLAALMGIFFDKQAVTFDQAPFALSASTSIRDKIIDYLKNTDNYSDEGLAYWAPQLIDCTADDLISRQDNISGEYVKGEFLSHWPPFSLLNTIGDQQPLDHGPTGISGLDLHSHALLTAFLEDDDFRQVTNRLTGFLDMLFDSKLYARETKSNQENFLDRLVRHEEGNAPSGDGSGNTIEADEMLTRFTEDLEKIAQDGGLTLTNDDVAKALTAFAMQMYYDDNNPNSTDEDKELFDDEGVTNGIHFDRSDVADTLDTAKGFKLYFQNYLNSLPGNENGPIAQQLPELLDWYVQTGFQGMQATAGDQQAFMLGGAYNDSLKGGSDDDVLYGGSGDDTLDGGEGADTMLGSTGDDTYYVDDEDDLLVEGVLEGTDTVHSTIDYTLPDNVEKLILDGEDDIDGTGNKLNNEITGNAADNIIDGGEGADTMMGGAGDDTFMVDSTGDIVKENAGEGDDTVISTVSYTLSDNVEDLILDGSNPLNGTGNVLDNEITGNAANNVIDGGAGADKMIGGAGNDTYYVDNPDDEITENPDEGKDTVITTSDYELPENVENLTLTGNAQEGTGNDLDNMITGNGNNTIDGGEGDDLLYVGSGSNTLTDDGGFDSYMLSGGNDTIEDADGDGRIFEGSMQFTGGKEETAVDEDGNEYGIGVFHDDSGNTYVWDDEDGDTLVINNMVTVPDFNNGELSIYLDQYEDDDDDDDDDDDTDPPPPKDEDDDDDGIGEDDDDDDDDPITTAGGPVATPPRRDPLVLDLNGDGIKTIRAKAGAHFDYDCNGFAEQTGWISAQDGLLVLDRNGNGKIDNGKELFGDQTILKNGQRAANGFQALAEFDSNHDGKIDANDPIYSQLRVWIDTNGNGYSSRAELHTLSELGIKAIDLSSTISRITDAQGNTQNRLGSFEKTDGSTGEIAEYSLQRDTVHTNATQWLNVPQSIAVLPDLNATGNVYDLQQAMVRDASGQLKALVEQFIAADDVTTRNNLMNQILFKWTGSDTISPTSRGSNIDARKLAVLEKFYGKAFVSQYGANPIYEAATILNEGYRKLSERFYAELMEQTHLHDLYQMITFPVDPATNIATIDISTVTTELQARIADNPVEGKQDLAEFARTIRGLGAQDKINYLEFRETFIMQDPSLGWVIDSAGLPVYDKMHTGTRAWSPHMEGTDNADAVINGMVDNGWGVNGLMGDDVLYGSNSHGDTIINETGNSLLVGGAYDDVLWAGAGNDTLDGGPGNDVLYGETGNDTYIFRRGSGKDTIYDTDSTAGNVDTIWLGSNLTPDDIILQKVGNDLVFTIKNDPTDILTVRNQFLNNSPVNRIECIQFSDGTTFNLNGINLRVGIVSQPTEGIDILYGTDKDDSLRGLGGDDQLYGFGGNDTLQGDAGNDVLYGGQGIDSIDGGTGNDFLYGEAGNDTLLGGEGNDSIYGGDGNDTIDSGAGNDLLSGEAGNDILFGGDGNDNISGGIGNDTIDGGAGNDAIDGGAGNDTYLFGRGSGQDTIQDYDSTPGNLDTIQLATDITPADVKLKRNGDNLVLSINGTMDTLTVNYWFYNDSNTYQIEQIQFADGTIWDANTIKQMTLQGTAGDDMLIGYSTADVIHGLEGNDQLYGQAGDDKLDGGAGNDSLFGGAGNDTLDGGAGNDQLSGGGSYDDWYASNGNDTYLFGRGSGQDTIQDYDKTPGNLDTIQLNSDITPDDVELSHDGDNLVLSINGTTDTLTVSNWFYNDSNSYQVERIQFADGTIWDADTIKQMMLQGTAGDDMLIGYSTADTIQGLGGNDQLYGRAGDDTLDGGEGNDNLYGEAGDDYLLGGEGNDSLYGGDGNDTLDGGAGNDMLFGGSKDRYYNYSSVSNGNDTYLFGRGSGQDTIQDYDKTAGNLDTILLNSDITPDDVMLRRNGEDLVLSLNDTSDTITVGNWFFNESSEYQVENIQFADGTIWDAAAIKQLVLQGTDGDDVLIGYSTADVISGFGGNDQLYGRAGDDTLDGGEGNDNLYGEAGDDYLLGGEGNDILYGNAGNDTLDGGAGNDQLYGGSFDDWGASNGNDTYLFGRGSGQDTIHDYDATAGNLDTILLNSDITPDDVMLRRNGEDLVLSLNDTSDTITVGNWFFNESSEYQVENIQFADGTIWDAAAIKQLVLQGTDGDDVLIGYSTADVISGFGGNDQLYGRAGDDTLDSGAGNDTLYGEAGNDTYLFGYGSGQDTVIDQDKTAGNLDTILLNADIAPTDVMLRRNGDDLVLSLNNTGESITVSKWFLNDSNEYQVEQIQFADGTSWDVEAIKQIVIQGTTDDDLLIGYSTADVISGFGGNDQLYGRAGDDTLDGGAGDDTLYGETGNDTYVFGRGYGQDKIIDIDNTPGNIDTVQLTPDVLPEDVTLTWGFDGLHLTINDTSDSLLLTSWFVSDKCKVESIQFADGTVWDTAMMQSIAGAPTYIEKQLTGTPDNDVLIGDATSDFIQGLDGNDCLYGGAGNDIILGDDGNDALYGGNGNDILDGGTGNDYLYGGSNTDYLNSSVSNGNDTYMFGYGAGQDVVIDYDKTPGNLDTILLNADITPGDVTLKRYNNDLVVSLNGSDDTMTVKYWFLNDENKVENIKFADGTVWDVPEIEQLVLQGTQFSDTLIGYSTDDTIMGYANGSYSPDELYGRGGDDVIYGGIQNDEISGDDGNDTLIGGEGNNNNYWIIDEDTLYGGAGDDVLDGGVGNDTLYGGSKGNWYLQSGTNGNDTYLFGNRSGSDLVYDYDETPGNVDTILIKDGINPDAVRLSRVDDDLVLAISQYNDQMAIGNWFLSDAYKVEQIKFSNGTIWDVPYINQNAYVDTYDSHDHTLANVTGTVGNDWLYGAGGDSLIEGLAGNDVLHGGYYFPRDYIHWGNYLGIDLGDGNDTLLGGAGNDTLYGGWGNDVLDGGPGNDKLYGGDNFRGRYWWDDLSDLPADNNGSDTYLFGRGSGQDIIFDRDATPGNVDTVLLDSNIQPSDVTLRRSNDDLGMFCSDSLILSIAGTDDTLTIQNWFDPSGEWKIEKVQFADGTVWDLPTIQQMLLQGTPGDDYLSGDSSADTLDGGAGNDTLNGGMGNDTYIFGRGYGQDTIIEDDITPGDVNTIKLQDDVLPADVTIKRGPNPFVIIDGCYCAGDIQNLYLTINGTTDQLQINDWFWDNQNCIERIQFSDGTVWDAAMIQSIVDTPTDKDDCIVGTPVNDAIDGGVGNDVIFGGAGDDAIYGGAGDDILYGYDPSNVFGWGGFDTLYGGAGNDTLKGAEISGYGDCVMDGGPGDDHIDAQNGQNTFIVNRGSGFDTIETNLSWRDDSVVFGDGITPEDISVQIGTGTGSGGSGGGGLMLAEVSTGGEGGGGGGTSESVQLAIGIGNNDGMLISASAMAGGEGGYGGSIALSDLAVRRFIFADGEELSLDQILAMADDGVIGEQYGTGDNEFLLGSVANDQIYGSYANDKIDGRDNEDQLFGNEGDDVISAGDGQDTVYGGDGDDIMAGGKGDDYLSGDYGNDVYAFNRGDGKDYIDNYPGGSSGDVDTLSFGVNVNPNDISGYVNSDGDLVLTIKESEDNIAVCWFDPSAGSAEYSDEGLSRVQFISAGGSARIFDLKGIVQSLSSELLAATADNPIALFTDATSGFELTGNVAQVGGDYAVAYAQTGDLFGVPTYYTGGSGDDVINGGAGNDTIDAGDGNNIVNAGDGNNNITAGAGDDQITSGSGNDTINAGNGYNVIDAGAGNDIISGGLDDDAIYAGDGNDTIIGGGGYDALIGGSGDDTYYFYKGDGVVTIDDLADASGGNRIIFGDNIKPGDLSLSTDGEWLIINVGNNGDSIYLTNFTADDAYGTHAVEDYEFADGQVLTYNQLIDKGFDILGTEGEDVLIGTSAADRITGLGGDDILVGGRGNDILTGSSGDDTYIFNIGDGIDTIRDTADLGFGNTVQFGAGISISDLKIYTDQNTLVVQVGEGGDALRFEGFNPADVYGNHAVETFRFSDGSTISYSELIDLGFTFTGTTGNDTLTGTNGNDTFIGGRGNDSLSGGSGNDTYIFNIGDGVDTISDEATPMTPNTIIFGQGISLADISLNHDLNNKELIINVGNNGDAVHLANFDATDPYSQHAVEYFQFADGQVLTYNQLIDHGFGFDITGTAGDDYLIGTAATDRIRGFAGNDTMTSGAGNDLMVGGDGDDTYIFNLGDGVDVLDDIATPTAGNTLVFGEGITASSLSRKITFNNDQLIIRVGDNGDEVHLTGFNPNEADTGQHAVDTFMFADGTMMNYEQLVKNTFIIQGGPGDDYLTGTNVTDRLYGYEGFDRLEGGAGNDVLTGGHGDDELIGGSGNDTYIFNIGDGVDTITDTAAPMEGNLIVFGEGITRNDLNFNQTGDVLTIQVGNNGDAIRLLNYDFNGINGSQVVKTIEFADGSQVQIADLLYPELGTEGDDVINTGPEDDLINAKGGNDLVSTDGGNDTVYGGTGDDTLSAGDGDDIIIGGGGNDILNGGNGNDRYVYNLGDGTDFIDDLAIAGAGNTLVFGPGISPDSLKLSYNDDVLIINVGTGSDSIRLANFDFNNVTGTHAIETFEFADGTALTYNELIYRGFDITGTNGDDLLNGTSANDRITAKIGDDIISSGAGDDLISAGNGNDTVYGGSGNDTVHGGSGNDLLDGGTGADSMLGGSGSDTYVFRLGDGVDTIEDTSTIAEGNKILFGEGITSSDLTMIRNGSVLTINIGNNGDAINLMNFDQNEVNGSLVVRTLQFNDGIQMNLADFLNESQNHPPTVVNPIANQSTLEDSAFSYTVPTNTFKDIDKGDTLTYSATLSDGTTLPSWLTFNASTMTFSGTPTNDNVGTLSLKVTATDTAGASIASSFNVEVINVNDPPFVVNPIANQSTLEDSAFSYTVPTNTFKDIDKGDTLAYSATLSDGTALPSWLTFNAATMTFSGTPTNDNVGTLSLKVTATDTAGASTASSFSVDVINVNDPPIVVNPLAYQSTMEDAAFSFTVPTNTFQDIDKGDTLTYSATLSDGTALPSWLTFNASTMTFSGTPTNDNVGTLSLKVTATDTAGASTASSFNVDVINVNDPPTVVNPIVNQSTLEDSAFSYTVPTNTFKDIDKGDTLTYSATLSDGTTLPSWLTFNASTMTFSGTPTNDNVGTLSLKVTATDTAGASIASSFNVEVINVNDPPFVVNPIANQSTLEDSAFSYTVPTNTFKDIDKGDTLAYSATLSDGTALPSWLTFNAATMTFSGTPTNDNVGTLSLKVTATDTAGASTASSFNVDVINVNDPPTVVNPIVNQSTLEDSAFSYTVPTNTFKDIDKGDTLTYSATLSDGTTLPSWLTFNASTMTFSGTPTNDNVGTLSLKVTATDTAGASIASSFNVEVINVNDPPFVVNPIANQSTLEDSAFSYTVPTNTFKDIDKGDTLAYSATLSDGTALPSWLTFNAATMTFSGTPTSIGTISIKVTATDTSAASVSSVFNLDIQTSAIMGTPYDDNLMGTTNNDRIYGLGGNDTINGGTGADTMFGGTGNDTYIVDNTVDVVTENANEGIDTVNSTITYTLGANVENLTLAGTAAINGTGNTLDNYIIGNSAANILTGGAGNDTLDGGKGADTMIGGTGNDTYIVNSSCDVVTENASEGIDTVNSSITYTLGSNLENLTLTGTCAINGTGNTLDNYIIGNSAANTLTGGAGNDTLDGSGGADKLIGGTGNDTYYVDSTCDVVTENASEGTDTVNSSITYTLGSNVENLTLTGTNAINGTGNALNNVLTGNSANNTLSGGTGADTMIGGLGNDTYVVDNTGDVVTENANEGTDTVNSSVTYTLGNNVENLTLTGCTAINGTGNDLNNVITGNGADNILDGGAGADTMAGGAGNDTYFVDNTGDVVTESCCQGTDTVNSSVTYTLVSNVENLTLIGTAAINGTGNTLNNIITGNSAANTLDGGTGADTLIGGKGNDTYIVDNTGDVVTENANEGTDTVNSSVTYTLATNVENLTLTGTSAINATGNALDNYLTGNSAANTLTGGAGNDTLDGGAGADKLIGGTGNDTYVVDNTSDVVTENASEGTDTVNSSITYTLGSNVENLTLTGTNAINGTGNALNNLITGNSAVNTLTGGAGNDTLDGGLGNDILTGGNGSDTYLFRRTDGQDTINETAGVAGDIDNLKLTNGITTTEPVLVKQNNDLYVFIDANNYVKIAAEFQATNYGVERLEVSDGHYITRADIQTIVDTMSSINNSTGMDVMQKYTAMMADTQYQNILAASWK